MKIIHEYIKIKIDQRFCSKSKPNASRRKAFDSVTDSSVLSNPADAHNVFCLGFCGRDICP